MGLFSRKPRVDPDEVMSMRHELNHLHARVDAEERDKAMLAAQIQLLDAATNALSARAHMMDEVNTRIAEVEVIKRQVATLDVVNGKIALLEGLNTKLTDLADRVEATSDEAKKAQDQNVTLHERISNVSTELANQLGELSREIDNLSAAKVTVEPTIAPAQIVAPDVLSDLSTAQIRLANEQARYEIAFRQDLALLAEQIKRARG